MEAMPDFNIEAIELLLKGKCEVLQKIDKQRKEELKEIEVIHKGPELI